LTGRSQDGEKLLSPRELKFVESVSSGASLADSATACGISLRTSARWHKRLQRAIRERATEQVTSARGVLAAGMARAARSLVSMAVGETVADGPRVSSCRAVLDMAIALTDLADVSDRLAALEAEKGKRE
jgi:hypothetical protein